MMIACAHAVVTSSFAAEKAKPAASAYADQTSLIAYQAVVSQLMEHPERLNGVAMKVRYQIDPQGRVHNVHTISKSPNRWAEETVRRALSSVKFPPPSRKVFEELGTQWVTAETQLGPIRSEAIGPKSTSGASVKSRTQAYVSRASTILRTALFAELAKHPERISGTVGVTLRVDRQGRVQVLKLLSSTSNRWMQQTTNRVIHAVRLPPIPQQVAAEQRHDWVEFQVEWDFERHE
jgi:TonB family protein